MYFPLINYTKEFFLKSRKRFVEKMTGDDVVARG